MKTDIYKVDHIGKGILYVMAKPVANEWMEEQFIDISQLGVHRIVSLLEKMEEKDLGLSNEQALTENHTMEFISYPIPDHGTPHSLKDFIQFTRKLYDDLNNGTHTVIHCRAGIGRTGTIAAGVLLHAGIEPSKAFQYISQARGITVPDTQQQKEWVEQSYDYLLNS